MCDVVCANANAHNIVMFICFVRCSTSISYFFSVSFYKLLLLSLFTRGCWNACYAHPAIMHMISAADTALWLQYFLNWHRHIVGKNLLINEWATGWRWRRAWETERERDSYRGEESENPFYWIHFEVIRVDKMYISTNLCAFSFGRRFRTLHRRRHRHIDMNLIVAIIMIVIVQCKMMGVWAACGSK